MRKSLIIIGILLFMNLVLAQEKNYFQQRANYTISVTLNDTLHQLTGFEKITYHNLSPDTLTKIYVHLWANGYSDRNTKLVEQQVNNGNTKLFYASPSQRGYIRNLDFKINGEPATYSSKKDESDIALIELPKPLLPGDSLILETPFLVKIPGDYSRMGHQEQSYQITQWFPKIAVYDTKGWHPMPYLDMGEFYSNFGSYDVSITLPENYFVAATGLMIENKEEKDRIEQRVEQSKGLLFTENDFQPSSTTLKTVRFYQDNIHDFAWFADKYFLISRKTITLPVSQREVVAYAYYSPENRDIWKDVPNYIEQTILFYSQKLGEYPYASCTAVEGVLAAGGGMEYPMITVVNSYDRKTTERVIVHEVGHNWLYGIIGFNEREYPWLDEGLNSFYENEFFEQKYPKAHLLDDFKFLEYFNTNQYPDFYSTYFAYRFANAHNDYQPIGLPSEDYSMINYGISVYFTPVMMFRYLKAYLGTPKFDEIMFEFANKWSFKHPMPSDLHHFFEEKTEMDLTWFFKKLIQTDTPIDQHISSIKPIKDSLNTYVLKSKDVSKLGAPYCITTHDKKGDVLTATWITPQHRINFDTITVPISTCKIGINQDLNIPELDKRDNEIRIHGIFKKTQLPKFSFLWKISNPSQSSVFYSPIIGWNSVDKFMAGIALYSDPIFPQKIDFLLSPMYSFSNNTPTGFGDLGYTSKSPIPFIKTYRIGVFAKQFGNRFLGDLNRYSKIEPSLEIQFFTPFQLNIVHQLKIRDVFVSQTTNTPTLTAHNQTSPINGNVYNYSVLDVQYLYQNKRKINPWSVNIDAQVLDKTIKFSFDYKTQYTYAKKKGLDFRFFFGKFINPSTGYLPNMKFYATGITSDYNNDYLFDQTLLGRSENEGILSQQMVGNDGGFVTPTPLGRTDDWLMAANLKVNIPGKLPLALFFNIASFGKYSDILQNKEFAIYEAGVAVILVKNIVEVYFPLYISKDMQRVSDLNNRKFSERIRFILNLNALNPFKAVKNYKQIIN